MEDLIRARRPIRREFNTLHSDLEKLLKEIPLQFDIIYVKFKLFCDEFEKLQVHDSGILEEMVRKKVSEEEEDKEYAEIREFKSRAETMRLLKDKMIPPRPKSPPGSVTGGGTEVKIRNFKLPTVQIQKFSGQLKDWLGFWAQFQKIDEDPYMDGSDKFWYLQQSLLPGTDAYEIVSNYPQSNENYEKVIDALKKQYGNQDILLQVYIRELLSLVISNANSKEKAPMKSLFLKLDSHLRALRTLQLERADPATWLFPLVESCLPDDLLCNWQRSELSLHDGSRDDPPRTRLDLLMGFVEKEVAIQQRIDLSRSFANTHAVDSKVHKNGKDKKQDSRGKVPTLSSFHTGDYRQCIFCDSGEHSSGSCDLAKTMSYEDKIKHLTSKGRCFRCCGNHMGRECRSRRLQCGICRRKHLTVLCRDYKRKTETTTEAPPAKKSRTEKDVPTTSSSSNLECMKEVALQTVMVILKSPGGSRKTVRAFIDSGSQRSYILRSTAEELKAEVCGVERVVHSLFGGRETSTLTHSKCELFLGSLDGEFEEKIEVRENAKLCGRIPKISKNSAVASELRGKGIILNDTGDCSENIELLIGADVYANIVTGRVAKLNCGAVAIHTMLGWTLLGSLEKLWNEFSLANMSLSMSVVDAPVTQLWELDVLGIRDPVQEKSSAEQFEEARRRFTEGIRKCDDRYFVKLPWKEEHSSLPENREVALKRLQGTSRRLLNHGVWDTYDGIFKEWEKEGFIEKVPVDCASSRKHYVPHRPVIKPESSTTPVRPVFDASCRVGRSPSLNDCLHKGENFVLKIPEILLRFREKSIAFVSDIRKAFLMIGVEIEDRDVLRFLWWKNKEMDQVEEYRHARVMFGTNCSPFILGAVLHYHLTNLEGDEAILGEKLLSTLYVDNCVASENSVEEYEVFKSGSVELLKRAGMDLRMWLSTVDGFEEEKNDVISVLGLHWDRKKDEMFVDVKDVTFPEKVTKRSILSTVQKVFDPVGFVAPAVLPMKVLLQRLWSQKLKWDEAVPEEFLVPFQKWCAEVKLLGEIKIPRLMNRGDIDRARWSLHTFTDASKEAYSAIVFLRVQLVDSVSVQLLAAKSRVSPVKRMTIPKLELMGCVIGTRLASMVKRALKIENLKEWYWTDSSTALAWISRENQWGVFVANRRGEINTLTRKEDWRHIPGVENPADLPSRGCTPKSLLASRWWEGPTWLYTAVDEWPVSTASIDEDEVAVEMRKSKVVAGVASFSILEELRKQHTFGGLVRITAYVHRFKYNMMTREASERRRGPLTQAELKEAEKNLIKEIQEREFPKEDRGRLIGLEWIEDEEGLIRVKTRLTHREDIPAFKYPLLLPGKCSEVKQLIKDFHRYYSHAGAGFLTVKLRSQYWILKGRRVVKDVISKCVSCRRFTAKSAVPEPAPLPLDRVKDSEIWEVTGMDLAGPLILRNGKKVWLVFFTCAVYRAVHIEIVNTLSTKGFIRVLEKFVKRYRRPAIIYSDNGTNFRGADNLFRALDWKKIEENEDTRAIEWKFNPVTASWWGGFWEVLIRVAKNLLNPWKEKC